MDRGVSLVESLVAMTMLSLAGAALVSLLVSNRVAIRTQEQRLFAATLAATRLEAAGRGNFLSLNGEPEVLEEGNVSYTVRSEAFEVVPPMVGVRRVRSTVAWTYRSVPRQEFRERIFTRGQM